MKKATGMEDSRLNAIKSALETMGSGQWKDSPHCPDLEFSKMNDDQLAESLRACRPVFLGFGSTEWRNFLDALLYLNVEQRILDAIAEEYPGMDRALEEGEEEEPNLYKKERLEVLSKIRYFPGITASTPAIADDDPEFYGNDDVFEDDEVDEEYCKIFSELKEYARIEAEAAQARANQIREQESRPKPSEVMKTTVQAISAAVRLLKMAEMNIHNVSIREAKSRKNMARKYFDDYGIGCENRSEQRIKHGIRNAICSTDKMIDLLQTVTCGENGEWIRHPHYQRENSWMRGDTIFDRSWETPTQSRAKRAYKRIPAEVKKAENLLRKESGYGDERSGAPE